MEINIGQRERRGRGCLSVYVTQRRDRGGFDPARAGSALFDGAAGQDFTAATAGSLRIEARHKHLMVATDGEVARMQSPLRYCIRAGALRVLVPAPDPPNS